MARRVVLVCGPPGAGKTTYARSLGLTVYDIDDPQWNLDETVFRRALARLAGNPDAQAVVIRSGATRTARAKAQSLIQATETEVITTPLDECIRRVVARGRQRPPMRTQIAAIKAWWSKYQAGSVDLSPVAPSTAQRGYGYPHQKRRAAVRPAVEAGRACCWRCGMLIEPGQPWDLGHDDHDRTKYRGPEHRGRECAAGGNRATAGRRTNVTLRRWSL